MVPVLLLSVPIIAGLVLFLIKNVEVAKKLALAASLLVLALGICAVSSNKTTTYIAEWIPSLGSIFSLKLYGVSKVLSLLNALSLPIILLATYKNNYQKSSFYALMFLMQAGIMGVFLAADALLFYFFWELALIPAYFLCSIWGGEKRIQVTFKFFIYTFVGSLFMLLGLVYLYLQTPGTHSFDWYKIVAAGNQLAASKQQIVFWLMFIAFAIKMPIFPFHTWQPSAYSQAPTAVTMVLSGVMVKMGVFAVIQWLLPVLPLAVVANAKIVIILSVIGMLYASLIAIKQDNVKKLIAYSSIAHIGLMSAALFTQNSTAFSGVVAQMFSHGINVIGLWIVADLIEKQLGVVKLSQLGGLAQKTPTLAILLVILAFANIALPLTNAFVGEFLMFSGLFNYSVCIAAFAGISIILGAVYTLGMVQKIFYGEVNAVSQNAVDVSLNIKIALIILVVLVLVLGVYPMPILNFAH